MRSYFIGPRPGYWLMVRLVRKDLVIYLNVITILENLVYDFLSNVTTLYVCSSQVRILLINQFSVRKRWGYLNTEDKNNTLLGAWWDHCLIMGFRPSQNTRYSAGYHLDLIMLTREAFGVIGKKSITNSIDQPFLRIMHGF